MRTLIGLVSVFFLACTPHVKLSAPTPDAPYAERRAAYETLRPTKPFKIGDPRTINMPESDTRTVGLILPSGQLMTLPGDMLPVVSSDSPTAIYTKRSKVLQRQAARIFYVTSLAIGLGLAGGALANKRADDRGLIRYVDIDLLLAGSMIGGFLNVVVSSGFAVAAARKREQAFLSYDQDLRSYLNLCPEDGALVDCAELVQQPSSSPASAPTTLDMQ